ncbi:MAG: cupin domain-containing protein [Pedobacter sp.]
MKKTSIKTAFTLQLGIALLLSCNVSAQTSKNSSDTLFPKGNRTPSEYFTGTAWLQPLVADDTTFNSMIGSVTFEPGARSNWHTHPAGQILIVIEGRGYTQERGKSIQVIHKGDVIKCLPNAEHWHGATPTRSMTHMAINPNTEKGIVTWLQKVTDLEYLNIK